MKLSFGRSASAGRRRVEQATTRTWPSPLPAMARGTVPADPVRTPPPAPHRAENNSENDAARKKARQARFSAFRSQVRTAPQIEKHTPPRTTSDVTAWPSQTPKTAFMAPCKRSQDNTNTRLQHRGPAGHDNVFRPKAAVGTAFTPARHKSSPILWRIGDWNNTFFRGFRPHKPQKLKFTNPSTHAWRDYNILFLPAFNAENSPGSQNSLSLIFVRTHFGATACRRCRATHDPVTLGSPHGSETDTSSRNSVIHNRIKRVSRRPICASWSPTQ